MIWSHFAPGLGGIALVIIAALSWSLVKFGSLNHAWLYANGYRIVVDTPMIRLPDGKPGDEQDAAFSIRNLADRPIKILGVKTSCSCVSTEALPTSIPPRGAKTLRLKLHLDETPTGVVDQTVTYHTDEPTAMKFTVRVTGRVIVLGSPISSPTNQLR